MDHLVDWSIVLVGCCCMCKSSGQSVNHLLIHYLIAWDL